MRALTVFMLFLWFPYHSLVAQEAELSAEQQEYIRWAQGVWDSLDPQRGEIRLPNGVASLTVPDDFYYLNPEDSERVLVEVWGNPPGQHTLGMLLPTAWTPFDEQAWAVTIEYEADGYVVDEDADEIDYDELLEQMRETTAQASLTRQEAGYEAIDLVGWAATPYYDQASHKLHWAKELRFGDQTEHTLNYNIRVLGRQGVLVLNFVAAMDQKEEIEANLNTVLALAEFDHGSRYEDFDPDIDQVAAYGIGALVAGKVAAKAGLFAAALLFLKKFWLLALVGLGVLLSKLRKKRPA